MLRDRSIGSWHIGHAIDAAASPGERAPKPRVLEGELRGRLQPLHEVLHEALEDLARERRLKVPRLAV